MKLSRGVTLVELVVATSIIAIITIISMNFLIAKFVAISRDNAQSNLHLDAQLSLDIINRDIKQSADIEDQNIWPDNYGPGAPGNLYGWQSGSNIAVIGRPAEDADQNILYEDPKTYVSYKDNLIYFVDNATHILYKRTLAAQVNGNSTKNSCPAGTPNCLADIILARNVTGFSLNYYDANDNLVTPSGARSVGVTLTLSKTQFGKTYTLTQTIQTVFRNK